MTERSKSETIHLQSLFLRHREDLRGYINKLMPRELERTVEPNDLLQDAYIDALSASEKWQEHLHDDAVMLRLLKTMIRTNVIDALRRFRRKKNGGGEVIGANDLPLASTERLLERMVLYERTPSHSAMSHEVHAMVEQTLKGLNPDHAAALRLRYTSGLSLKDVGEKMSRSQEAAEQLCRRAMAELRQRLTAVLPAFQ